MEIGLIKLSRNGHTWWIATCRNRGTIGWGYSVWAAIHMAKQHLGISFGRRVELREPVRKGPNRLTLIACVD